MDDYNDVSFVSLLNEARFILRDVTYMELDFDLISMSDHKLVLVEDLVDSLSEDDIIRIGVTKDLLILELLDELNN